MANQDDVACCHPSIPEESQIIIITLQFECEEIAGGISDKR
jgi:hypothetical protein